MKQGVQYTLTLIHRHCERSEVISNLRKQLRSLIQVYASLALTSVVNGYPDENGVYYHADDEATAYSIPIAQL